jgi:hypothetical protein
MIGFSFCIVSATFAIRLRWQRLTGIRRRSCRSDHLFRGLCPQTPATFVALHPGRFGQGVLRMGCAHFIRKTRARRSGGLRRLTSPGAAPLAPATFFAPFCNSHPQQRMLGGCAPCPCDLFRPVLQFTTQQRMLGGCDPCPCDHFRHSP